MDAQLEITKAKTARISKGNWVAIILLAFSGQLAWAVENQFFNTYMYENITPDPRPISWMVSASAIAALITTILMGTLSDGTPKGRWGKRRPYILIGSLFFGLFTALYPAAALFRSVALGVTMAILFDVVMTFFGSTANDSAFNAFVADITVKENRGRVVSITELLRWLALLITYGGAGFFISSVGYLGFFIFVGVLTSVAGVVGALIARETADVEMPKEKYWRRIINTFSWKSLTANRNLFLLFLAVMVFTIFFNVFFPYLLIYIQHYVKLDTLQSSLMVAVAILIGGISMGYPLGILTDRWGRRNVALTAVGLEFAGLLLFSFSKSFIALLISGILWVLPYTAWSIATFTWEKDLFPEESRGQYSGWVILFWVAIPMVIGPLLGGWLATHYGIPTILDGKPGFIPTPIVFQVAALGMLLVYLPLLATREQKK